MRLPLNPLLRRLALLLPCVVAGLIIGVIGKHKTSEEAWFLAVPVCIALGWAFVANPDECISPHCPPKQDDQPPQP